jgi:Pectate lyase superfamily protein
MPAGFTQASLGWLPPLPVQYSMDPYQIANAIMGWTGQLSNWSRQVSGRLNLPLITSTFNVLWFGARGDGVTDDTHAVNLALNAAAANGGGTVYFPSTGFAYLIGTGLVVPNNVNLLGDSGFEWSGANFVFPSTNWTKGGSWIQFTDLVNPGITLQNGSRVSRLNFGYAQPVPSSTPATAWTPTTFPYTIQITGNFNGLEDITILNASHGVDWEYGSVSGGGTYCFMQDCFITGFYICMRIKNANDTMCFRNIHHRNLWYVQNSNIVDWQEGSGARVGQTGWDIQYLDNPIIEGLEFFQQHIGILLTDSTVASTTHAIALGQFNDISFNLCVQAINMAAGSTNATMMFNNIICQSDTSTNRAASFFFNLASDNVVALFNNLYVTFVGNGLFSIGAGGVGGKVSIDQIRVDSYGTFAASVCFTINTNAVLDLPCGHANIVTQGGAGAKFGGVVAKTQDIFMQNRLIVNGATVAIRHGAQGTAGIIEGRDPTGLVSYQPIQLGGSQINLTLSGTSDAQLDTVSGWQAHGTTTNDNATGGWIGEYVSQIVLVASEVNINAAANVVTLSLAAGDWDVSGELWVDNGTGAATINPALTVRAGITTTSATIPTVPADNTARTSFLPQIPNSSTTVMVLPIGPVRISLATTTNVFLVAVAAVTAGTAFGYGKLIARRRR